MQTSSETFMLTQKQTFVSSMMVLQNTQVTAKLLYNRIKIAPTTSYTLISSNNSPFGQMFFWETTLIDSGQLQASEKVFIDGLSCRKSKIKCVNSEDQKMIKVTNGVC
jgi:hypothetical protein